MNDERWKKVVENVGNYFDYFFYSSSLRNKSILETKNRHELSLPPNIKIKLLKILHYMRNTFNDLSLYIF